MITITDMTTNRQTCEAASQAVAAALDCIAPTYQKITYTVARGTRTQWVFCLPDELEHDNFFQRIPAFSTRKAAVAGWEAWKAEAATAGYCANFVLYGIESPWFDTVTC